MTDREMLELAALAVHHTRDPDFMNFEVVEDGSCVLLELGVRRGAITSYWNPRDDDGASHRLAATLRINVVWLSAHEVDADGSVESIEHHSNDPSAAARHAVLRAAAELGKKVLATQQATP